MFLSELLALINKIPATFWGVVIGAFFSLSGVMLTNRANDRRLQAQLSHERELRKKERELSLRKDIYLAAAEAISAGITAIGHFADIDIPNNKLTEAYVEKSPSIAKVHIIAGEETVKAVVRLVSELGAAYLQLFAKRIPLAVQKNQITILEQQIENFGKERDRMVDLMKQSNLDGVVEPRFWEMLQKNFEFEQGRVDETTKQHGALVADFLAKQSAYATECIAETVRLNQLVVPALVAVRTELELPISESVYMQVFEQGSRKMEGHLKEFLQSVQQFTTARPSDGEEPQ